MKAALLPDRGVVKVAGLDARKFLNGLVTADVAKVAPAQPRFAALLTPQGKIIAKGGRIFMAEHNGEAVGCVALIRMEDGGYEVRTLVGDIRDEFDVEKGPFFERTENSVLVDADMPLRDLATEMDWPLPMYTSSTVEKWCLNHWRRIPEKGEVLELDGLKIVAEETTKRGLRRVRLTRVAPPSEE